MQIDSASPAARRQRATPTPRTPGALQIADELAVMVTGVVAGAAVMPGFFLCAPGLAFAVVVAMIPVVALALVAAALALAILLAAVPVLVGRRIARRLRRRVTHLRVPRVQSRGRAGVRGLPEYSAHTPKVLAQTFPVDIDGGMAVHRAEGR